MKCVICGKEMSSNTEETAIPGQFICLRCGMSYSGVPPRCDVYEDVAEAFKEFYKRTKVFVYFGYWSEKNTVPPPGMERFTRWLKRVHPDIYERRKSYG